MGEPWCCQAVIVSVEVEGVRDVIVVCVGSGGNWRPARPTADQLRPNGARVQRRIEGWDSRCADGLRLLAEGRHVLLEAAEDDVASVAEEGAHARRRADAVRIAKDELA